MLQEERFARIQILVDEQGSATVQQLMTELDASESTIRRDLGTMDERGMLTKVHGGALSNRTSIQTIDEDIRSRKQLHMEDKVIIASYAASLITDSDFVYLDAGSTTEEMISHVEAKGATFVTNAIDQARILSELGFRVFILGGEFKSSTQAIVGEEAVATVDKYNFTKGFFGTNGITEKNGYTTPEVKEAMLKRKAMENCKECYILADASKFGEISSVKFAEFDRATVITTGLDKKGYKKYKNVKEV